MAMRITPRAEMERAAAAAYAWWQEEQRIAAFWESDILPGVDNDGRQLTPEQLADAIRTWGVPAGSAAAEYVIRWVTGELRPPAHRPTLEGSGKRPPAWLILARYESLLNRLQYMRRKNPRGYQKQFGGTSPFKAARKMIVAATPMVNSEKTLEKILADARRTP